MVFDLNRIYIGTFLLLVLLVTYFLKLDYLILLAITIFAFYDLFKSKFLVSFKELFISIFFLFLIFYIGIIYDYLKYLNIILITITFLLIIKKDFYQKKLFTFLIIIFIYNFYVLTFQSRELLYFLILVSFFNDTLAFIFGRLIGGPLIVPSISPKKTISGTIISFLFTLVLIYIFDYPFYLSILLSASLFFGDIFFSSVKRNNKIKDFSNILKGHGGILDRLDSMFFFIIIINFYS